MEGTRKAKVVAGHLHFLLYHHISHAEAMAIVKRQE